MKNLSSCVYPIRWVSLRKEWTAASTMRKPAGKGVEFGRPGVPAHPSTARPVKEPPARWCTFKFALTRLQISDRLRVLRFRSQRSCAPRKRPHARKAWGRKFLLQSVSEDD